MLSPDQRTLDEAAAVPDLDLGTCQAYQRLLELVGRRWTGAVLLAANRGARRFRDYRRMVPGISDRLLSARLKELEELGLLEREVVPTTPVQILYRPTLQGAEFMAAIGPLVTWGTRHVQSGGPAADR
ncbi:winged helix-turn-helix transcriptional regulator [Actinomadura macrotermitis]|uniref:HTH-type transcriptional regulator YodB n=1 Tax=Actinomadura macrotermitis TaxID=2585200 RepID=A0A7K0C350_9ACTN|nr:HTH-type transcriptional regulator YodB [Actinomadura macrotermitis]